MDYTDLVLKPCKICGRSFNLVSLDKHESICESNKKLTRRTVFKSFMQRSKEIDLVPLEKEEEKFKPKCRDQESKRKHSLNLLNNGQSSIKSVPPDYQQCPSCDRYFNKKAADRHINWCQEQKHRLQKTPTNPEALERLQARIKYIAPRPRKKSSPDGSLRLVKSAESVRDCYRLRTHSSPSIHSCNISYDSSHQNVNKLLENKLPRDNLYNSRNKSKDNTSNRDMQEQEIKKVVKFKEQFPMHDKERNKNLDMLKVLRLHLSQLSVSDEHIDSYILQSKIQENQKCSSDDFSLPVMKKKSIDNDINFNNYSNKDVSTNATENAEKRMPKFCYNCGTKYPVVNAKYCCECGVRRLVLGLYDERNISECY